jgi:putative transposase
VEPHPVFSPVLAAANRFEFLLKQRMVRVNYSERSILNVVNVAHLKTHANCYAERFVRTIKGDCLERMILFGEESLRTAVREFMAHYHGERNHQGLGNLLIIPDRKLAFCNGAVQRQSRLGSMLNYYRRAA